MPSYPQHLVSVIDTSKPAYEGDELVLVQGFLDEAACAELVAFSDDQAGVAAPVGIGSAGGAANTQNQGFIADRINLTSHPEMRLKAIDIVTRIYKDHVDPAYGVSSEWFELPHILRYGAGGNYNHHADAENWNPQLNRWVRGVDRDYSAVLYLNDDFEGGTLAFSGCNLRVHPERGLLAIFPSDHRFVHCAEETTSGLRYALVTWGAVRNTPRVLTPPQIIRL